VRADRSASGRGRRRATAGPCRPGSRGPRTPGGSTQVAPSPCGHARSRRSTGEAPGSQRPGRPGASVDAPERSEPCSRTGRRPWRHPIERRLSATYPSVVLQRLVGTIPTPAGRRAPARKRGISAKTERSQTLGGPLTAFGPRSTLTGRAFEHDRLVGCRSETPPGASTCRSSVPTVRPRAALAENQGQRGPGADPGVAAAGPKTDRPFTSDPWTTRAQPHHGPWTSHSPTVDDRPPSVDDRCPSVEDPNTTSSDTVPDATTTSCGFGLD
jgi:hypothetical protein